ncbi:hypothetical protein Pelo_18024 [Pelomyxa schiedti]|nr:hypothetical protein Pelo_18024 [Pelomyxa schiedti]
MQDRSGAHDGGVPQRQQRGHDDVDYFTALSTDCLRTWADDCDTNREPAQSGGGGEHTHLEYLQRSPMGVALNREEGLRLLRIGAEKGDSWCQFQMARSVAEEGDPAKKHARVAEVAQARLSDQGLPGAQYSMALELGNTDCCGGKGKENHQVESLRLFKLAAAQGMAAAQSELGMLYLKGNGPTPASHDHLPLHSRPTRHLSHPGRCGSGERSFPFSSCPSTRVVNNRGGGNNTDDFSCSRHWPVLGFPTFNTSNILEVQQWGPEGAVKVFVYDDASSAGGGVYAGRLVDGECDGRGTCKWTNGNTYEGEWKDGLTHGRGVHWWADSNTYDGELRKGKEEGWGVPVAQQQLVRGAVEGQPLEKGDLAPQQQQPRWWELCCDRYDGQWVQGKEHGEGTKMWSRDGSSFTGLWVRGDPIEGTRRWPNGDKFEGTFTQDGGGSGWECRGGEGVATLSPSSAGKKLLGQTLTVQNSDPGVCQEHLNTHSSNWNLQSCASVS